MSRSIKRLDLSDPRVVKQLARKKRKQSWRDKKNKNLHKKKRPLRTYGLEED